ncbi:MAG: hypothetical protein IPG93_02770 [Burkholderiales bacterium]|nr:hypothetical protein [Burkholderiales bacterium]
MPHIQRNRQGDITSLHRDAVPGGEYLPDEHPEVQAFVGRPAAPVDATAALFASLDSDVIRVIEDLVDVLVARNVIRITDLPAEAQLKLFDRKSFREGVKRSSLQLFATSTGFDIDSGVVPTGAFAAPPPTGAVNHRGLRASDDDVL